MELLTKRLSRLLGFVLLLTASSTFATHHSWKMAVVFSNLDGTLQFVELISTQNDHSQLSCCFLVAGNAETGVDTGFKPTNLSSTLTNGHSLLFATAGFEAEYGITPDYIIDDNFLTTGPGDVEYVDRLSWSSLPTDGFNSLKSNDEVSPATPKNFSGTEITLQAESAPTYLGRAYHMTASTSPNLSEVHIINTSDSALSFTGTLYHKSGAKLGDSDVALHEGIIKPLGRLILFSTDLEQRFNESSWTGPAILDVTSNNQFELMTKLSRSGRVTNTNCVRTGDVHNVEGTESPDVTYIRFINDGSTTISDIRATLYDADGNMIGLPDTQYFEELGPREAVFKSRGSINNIVGETWEGVASLVLSETYENLQLMNLNFVNDETFFNFSCFVSASDQSGG
jgi:hypothetical protein